MKTKFHMHFIHSLPIIPVKVSDEERNITKKKYNWSVLRCS